MKKLTFALLLALLCCFNAPAWSVTEIYVDWSAAGGQNSGTGSIGDPYGSIEYALTQQAAAQPNLATLAGLTVHVDDSANTGTAANDTQIVLSGFGFTNAAAPTNVIELRAGANKRPTGTGPALTILGVGSPVLLTADVTGTIVDGFRFGHTDTSFVNVRALVTSTAGTNVKLRNCAFDMADRAWGTTQTYISHANGLEVENCLFRGGRVWIEGVAGSNTRTVRNCTFVNQAVSDEAIGSGGASTYHSNAFYGVLGTAINNDADFTGANNAIDATSVQGKTGIWSITNLTTGAFANYAGIDYRAVDGGALEDAGDGSNSTATDMFGVSRTTPDIGFSEAVTAPVGCLLCILQQQQ